MNPTLEQVIAQAESRTNSFAMRFEPAKFAYFNTSILSPSSRELLKTIADANRCNYATAAMIASTSWGRFQIMGENIYSICRFTAPIALYLNGVSQSACFAEFLAVHKFDPDAVLTDADELRRFATVYNGPAAPDAYVARIQQAIEELTVSTPRDLQEYL